MVVLRRETSVSRHSSSVTVFAGNQSRELGSKNNDGERSCEQIFDTRVARVCRAITADQDSDGRPGSPIPSMIVFAANGCSTTTQPR
jgi:hypothetical protein